MKTIHCYECDAITAKLEAGSVIDKNAVMLCKKCYNELCGITVQPPLKDSVSAGHDAFNNLMNVFKGFK